MYVVQFLAVFMVEMSYNAFFLRCELMSSCQIRDAPWARLESLYKVTPRLDMETNIGWCIHTLRLDVIEDIMFSSFRLRVWIIRPRLSVQHKIYVYLCFEKRRWCSVSRITDFSLEWHFQEGWIMMLQMQAQFALYGE